MTASFLISMRSSSAEGRVGTPGQVTLSRAFLKLGDCAFTELSSIREEDKRAFGLACTQRSVERLNRSPACCVTSRRDHPIGCMGANGSCKRCLACLIQWMGTTRHVDA